MSSIDPFAPIAPNLTSSASTTLVLQKIQHKIATVESPTVSDVFGNAIFNVDSKLISLSQRRLLLDPKGNVVGQIRHRKHPGMHRCIYIGSEDEEKKCSIKTKVGSHHRPQSTNCLIDIFMGDKVIGVVTGNWKTKSCAIKIQGKEVAQTSLKTNVPNFHLEESSYMMEVKSGVDLAFISMIAIALDEIYEAD